MGLAYLTGGSDVPGGTGPRIKGPYGVLVLIDRGGQWQVSSRAIPFQGHS